MKVKYGTRLLVEPSTEFEADFLSHQFDHCEVCLQRYEDGKVMGLLITPHPVNEIAIDVGISHPTDGERSPR